MSDATQLRSGGIAGIVFILLAFGAVTFASGSRTGEFMLQLSSLPALWFTIAVWVYLRQREGGAGGLAMLFLVGSLVSDAVFVIVSANNAMLAARHASPATIAYLNDADTFIAIASYFPLAAGLVGAGLSILASRAMPVWIGALALLAGLGQLAITLPVIANSSLFSDSGPIFALAQLVYVVWLFSVAIAMLLKSTGPLTSAPK